MTDNDKDIPLWALDIAAQVAGRKDWEEFKKSCLVPSTYRLVKTLAAVIAKHKEQRSAALKLRAMTGEE